MATAKKTVAKKVVAKKAPAKKVVAKKAPAKKQFGSQKSKQKAGMQICIPAFFISSPILNRAIKIYFRVIFF